MHQFLEPGPQPDRISDLPSLLQTLRSITTTATDERPARRLSLRRSWLLEPGRIALEYESPAGDAIAGQWFADEHRLAEVVRRTRERSGGQVSAVVAGGSCVMLQEDGADRKIRGLAPLVAAGGALILGHRAERRAVVRLKRDGNDVFAKVVRRGKTEAVARAGKAAEALAGDEFATPRMLGADMNNGVVFSSAVGGRQLFDLYDDRDALVEGWRQAGKALAALHRRPAQGISRVHGAAEEAAVLKAWMRRLEVVSPMLASDLGPAAARVLQLLRNGSSATTVLHRDFHDKQVIVAPVDQPGLIDFDTLAVGEPALDVANALVHIDLRRAQGMCTADDRLAAQAAFLDSYAPSHATLGRIPAYSLASALRLVCVYSFRPDTDTLIAKLASSISGNGTGACLRAQRPERIDAPGKDAYWK